MTHKYIYYVLKANKDWPTAQGQPNFLGKLYSSQIFGFENAFCELCPVSSVGLLQRMTQA